MNVKKGQDYAWKIKGNTWILQKITFVCLESSIQSEAW